MNKLFVFVLLLPVICLAQENPSEFLDTEVTEDSIILKLESLLGKEEGDFISNIAIVNELVDRYIEQKKGVCAGSMSSIDLSGDGILMPKKSERGVKQKLTRKERRLCQYLLLKFRIRYTKVAFKLRKSYLIIQQEKQLNNLDMLKNKSIQELEKLSFKLK